LLQCSSLVSLLIMLHVQLYCSLKQFRNNVNWTLTVLNSKSQHWFWIPFTVQGHPWKVDSCSTVQEIPSLYRNWMSITMFTKLCCWSQLNPVHPFIPFYLMIHFNIFFSSMPMSPK
jgi:hypothetical protein